MCTFDAMSERRIHAFTHVTAINWSYSSEQFISAMLSKVRASKKKIVRARNSSHAIAVLYHYSPSFANIANGKKIMPSRSSSLTAFAHLRLSRSSRG
jgi:hypothetical protein